MADKIVTAVSLKLGDVACSIDGDVHDVGETAIIDLSAPFTYLDSGDNPIPDLRRGKINVNVVMSSLPANIKTALKDIDTYLNDQALLQEGMD